jgi:hypothetical protein
LSTIPREKEANVCGHIGVLPPIKGEGKKQKSFSTGMSAILVGNTRKCFRIRGKNWFVFSLIGLVIQVSYKIQGIYIYFISGKN